MHMIYVKDRIEHRNFETKYRQDFQTAHTCSFMITKQLKQSYKVTYAMLDPSARTPAALTTWRGYTYVHFSKIVQIKKKLFLFWSPLLGLFPTMHNRHAMFCNTQILLHPKVFSANFIQSKCFPKCVWLYDRKLVPNMRVDVWSELIRKDIDTGLTLQTGDQIFWTNILVQTHCHSWLHK